MLLATAARRIRGALALGVALIVVAGCGGEEMRTYTDTGTEIVTSAGGEFAIELPINPSTGYSWAVLPPPGIVLRTDAVVADPDVETGEGMVGVPAVQRFTFRSDVAGTGELRFELTPPGEGAAVEQVEIFRVLTE
jgi:predicted secreted protein